jgi:hypothetical protein
MNKQRLNSAALFVIVSVLSIHSLNAHMWRFLDYSKTGEQADQELPI